MKTNEITQLNEKFANATPEALLGYFLDRYGSRIALSSSLSIEDQVLTDMICRLKPDARIFTLDTGRLFPETYNLIDQTAMHYGIRLEVFFPDCTEVEKLVADCGINGFYESLEKRKRCCRIRKLDPLERALRGLDAWICGLRREQSVTRSEMRAIEWDETHDLLKINPLIDWHEEQVWEYIRRNHVPYNKLHEQGFPSIGCQPCTRAVKPGEDIRAGRWWESPDHKECGLHLRK